jgi:ACT domain-containing protein
VTSPERRSSNTHPNNELKSEHNHEQTQTQTETEPQREVDTDTDTDTDSEADDTPASLPDFTASNDSDTVTGKDPKPDCDIIATPVDHSADKTQTETRIEADGGNSTQPHTVRLELTDEPGQLLAALQPIAENGGNLLSIFHERGNLTPRGRIPVEVDLECPPERFDIIVDALRAEGVNIIQAGAERYAEEVIVMLMGDLVETDLSDTLERIEECGSASVADVALSAPEGRDDVSSARLRLATRAGKTADAIASVRDVAADKNLHLVEPLTEEAI